MSEASGAIGEGHYQIVDTRDIINDKGLSENVNYKQMKVISSRNNNAEADLENNGQHQSYRKQIIINSQTENEIQNEGNGQIGSSTVILNNSRKEIINNRKNSGSSKYSGNSKKTGKSGNNDLSQQISSGQVVFNSRLKTDRAQYSTNSTGVMKGKPNVITTRKEYERKIITNGDRNNEQIVTETRKVTEFKKSSRKTKNVEPLRDYDSQNSF